MSASSSVARSCLLVALGVPSAVRAQERAVEPSVRAGTEEVDPRAAPARALLKDARAAYGRQDLGTARAKAGEAIASLLAEPRGADTEEKTVLLAELGTLANDAGDLQAAER